MNGQVTRQVLMRYFACCNQTITNLIERRVIAPEPNGLFDLEQCCAAYVRVLREAAAGQGCSVL